MKWSPHEDSHEKKDFPIRLNCHSAEEHIVASHMVTKQHVTTFWECPEKVGELLQLLELELELDQVLKLSVLDFQMYRGGGVALVELELELELEVEQVLKLSVLDFQMWLGGGVALALWWSVRQSC